MILHQFAGFSGVHGVKTAPRIVVRTVKMVGPNVTHRGFMEDRY